MVPFDGMSAAVDALYAAAAGQTDWHDALDHVVDTMGYTHASVYASDRRVIAAATDSYRLPVTGFWHRHDASAQREYEAEYYKHELGRHYFLRNPGTRIRHDLMFATEAELDRSAFYDWAERIAGLHFFMTGQTDPNRAVGAALSVHRPRRLGPTTPEDVERFRRLLDHFERAVQVEHYMGKALAAEVSGLDFLERNPTGIVILDGLGWVVVANRAARAMAKRADGFALASEGIAALRPREDEPLQRSIAAAARTTAGQGLSTDQGLSSGGAFRLPRRTGQRDYVVIVAPLSRSESVLSSLTPAACVMIIDPETMPAHSTAMLRQTYQITEAEARLANRLAGGDTLEKAAEALGVTVATVRAQLASLFRKTETGRQAELVRLLVALPWWSTPGSQSGPEG